MASPFRYFRKHTKAFMAIASVVAIALFVFGRSTGGSGTRGANQRYATAKVATWNGGSINEMQLQAYVQHRLITNEFLRMLFAQGGGTSEYDLPQTVPNFVIPTNPTETVELDVINTEVFSSLATQAGMSVSDGMVNHYLKEFGLRRVDSDGIRGILSHMGSGSGGTNENVVFGTLRKLLLAYFYRRSFEDAGAVVLPEQRWEDWRRVNERISLEAAKLPVEEFLDKVAEPTEADLKSLYEQFKEADPNNMVSVGSRQLPSPDPAFAVPRRFKLQYLAASVSERTQGLLDAVTEEEIAEYYEANKRKEFTKTDADDAGFDSDAPPAEGADGEGATNGGAAEGGAATEGTPGTAVEGGSPAADAPADGATPPATGATPTSEPAAGGVAEPTTPAGESAAPAQPGSETPPPATGDQSRNARRRSPFLLTALQTPAGDASGATAPAEGDPAATPPVEGAAAPAADPPASAETPSGEPAAAAAEGARPADQAKDGSTDAASTEEPVEYVPLEKVHDDIRETLAREKAVEKLQQDIAEAYTKLQLEYNQYGRQAAVAREEEKPVPPAPEKLKNLKWLADEYGLSLVTTESLTWRELNDTPVGKATDDQSGRLSVTQAVYSSLELFEPFLAKELEGDWYLVTKVEDTPHRVPSFEEVRDKVAAAWKRIEAGKLAVKTAKELAEASEKGAESFETFFKEKGYEVVPQTALFSWRSYPLGPGMGYPPELSEVPDLKNVGPDFMEAAFGLDGAKTVGLLNFDKSVAYVIRLHSRQYTPEELKGLFLKEDNTWPGRMDMLREHQGAFSQVVNRRIWEDLAKFKFDEEWEKRRAERLAQKN